MGVLAKGAGVLADWVKAGYPEEVAKRIVSGELPMDEASRLARAQEQGYGPVLYRGQPDRPLSSNQDVWASTSPDVAQTYADNFTVSHRDALGEDGIVIPLRTNADNMADVNARGRSWHVVESNNRKIPNIESGVLKGTDRISEAVKDSGVYNGTVFRNIPDDAVRLRGAEQADTYNILGSRPDVKIRHADAAFDPQYTGSNIMGNATVPMLGATAVGTAGALAAPALKSEGLDQATGFLDETIRSARHAAGPLSFLVPYEGISNFAKKWNADEDLTWRDYLGLLDF